MMKGCIRVFDYPAISMPIKGWLRGDPFDVGLTVLLGRMTSIGVAFSRFRRDPREYDKPEEGRSDKASIWPTQLLDVQRADALQKNRRPNENVGPLRLRMVLSWQLRGHPA